jgi:hypothetical protein
VFEGDKKLENEHDNITRSSQKSEPQSTSKKASTEEIATPDTTDTTSAAKNSTETMRRK